MISVSLCMIVKNEENVLARCLDSLSGLFDETIIVDTGSEDLTKEIALKYTDKIYDYTWKDDFADARNYAFSKCNCDYIYCADADEVLDEFNYAKFQQLKELILPEIEIVQMWYINKHDYGTTENFRKEYRPKLYKRLRPFTWIDPIHESVNLVPVVYDSDIEILHMPENSHSSRDFSIFIKAARRDGGLSSKLFKMYATELLLSGKQEDFKNAEEYFALRLFSGELSETESSMAYAVLCAYYRMSSETNEFFKYALKNIATKPCSEVCCELGQYYEDAGDYDEALCWYTNALKETEPVVNAASSEKIPYMGMSRCLEKLGYADDAKEYREKSESIVLY